MKSLKKLVLALGILVIAGTWFTELALRTKAALNEVMPNNKIYQLVLFGRLGPQPVGIGRLEIENVSRKSDGTLCFTVVESGKYSCLKFDLYELTEIEVK